MRCAQSATCDNSPMSSPPTPPAPRVRAVACKQTLTTIRTLPEPDIVLSRIPKDVLEEIEGASSMAWIPLPRQAQVVDALRTFLGPEAFRRICREHTRALLESAVLASAVASAMRLVGVGPHALARQAPRAFDMLYRDCGSLRYQAGASAQELVLVLDGFPGPGLLPRLDVLAGSFEVIFFFATVDGEIKVRHVDPAAGHAEFVFRWT